MDQIEASRYAGRINSEAIEVGHKAMKPNVTLLEIDKVVEDYILSHGCSPVFKGYRDFPATCCLSPNDVVVHGVPNNYALKYGDILTIDVGCSYEGWMVDSARTFLLEDVFDKLCNPEKIALHRQQERLIYASETILENQLNVIKSGCSLLDILKASEEASKQNFGSIANPSPKLNIFPQWFGHHIGRELHMEPSIGSCIDPSLSSIKRWQLEREYDKHKLQAGSVVCLEPVVTFGTTECIVDADGWTVRSADGSLVAHTEQCVLILENGFEILT